MKKNAEYRYFKVTKDDRDIFVVKFYNNQDNLSDMAKMIDNLTDRGYILKEITEIEHKNFDYSKVSRSDINEFMSGSEYFEMGGRVFNDKELLAKYNRGESIGFTGVAHLKAKGLIKRADGTKRKSPKYKKYSDGGETNQKVDFNNFCLCKRDKDIDLNRYYYQGLIYRCKIIKSKNKESNQFTAKIYNDNDRYVSLDKSVFDLYFEILKESKLYRVKVENVETGNEWVKGSYSDKQKAINEIKYKQKEFDDKWDFYLQEFIVSNSKNSGFVKEELVSEELVDRVYFKGGEIKGISKKFIKKPNSKITDVSKLKEMFDIQRKGSFKDKLKFAKENPEIFMGKFSNGGKTTTKFYRAVVEYLGIETKFVPKGYYEAFDDDGNPMTRGATDVFVRSNYPELSASKTIGGSILGLWSMLNSNGINVNGFKAYIYEIAEMPNKDLSHIRMADFEYLKEVRYNKAVIGKYVGYYSYTEDFNKNAINFYERLNDDDPYIEKEYDIELWDEFENYISTLNISNLRYSKGGEIKITQKSREFDADVFNELEDEENLSGFLVKDGNKEIGIVRVEENIYEKGVGYILGLEVFEKGKGYGKKIIEKIFQLHPTQHSFAGKATLTSKGFWLKLGAEFEDDYYFIIKKSKTKFTNGGNVLLAPNGNPTNLTPEQYKLVRTPEFKAWFGDWEKAYKLAITQNKGAKYGLIKENILRGWQQNDKIVYLNHPAYKNVSKVLDDNGEPLIVYHGTKISSNVFNLGDVTNKEWKEVKDAQFRSGADPTAFVGSHFAKEYSVAREFAIEKKYKKIKGSIASKLIEKEVGSIKSFFLNIKSIFLYDELNEPIDENDWQKDMQSQYVSDIKKYISSIDISQDLFLDNYREFIENYKESYEFRQQVHTLIMSVGDILSIRLAEKLAKMYRNMLNKKYNGEYFPDQENKKFDGIVYKNYWEGGISYCVWDATKIKLADGTNTTFDSNNPDIRYDEGGNVLLAPNGNQSNLAPEQYKLVRTPEFKRWFGDWENSDDEIKSNMLLDKNGEPLVLWTGANSKIQENPLFYTKFDNKYADRFFFTTQEDWARIRGGGIAYPYFIKSNEIRKYNYELDSGYNLPIPENKYQVDVFYNGNWKEEDGSDSAEYIVFNPYQIKLADGTNTTFDSNNPDTRYDDGGEIILSIEKVEQILGRKLHWWNDDVVTIQGSQYKKVFLKSEYRKI